jgi:hypothetical protein
VSNIDKKGAFQNDGHGSSGNRVNADGDKALHTEHHDENRSMASYGTDYSEDSYNTEDEYEYDGELGMRLAIYARELIGGFSTVEGLLSSSADPNLRAYASHANSRIKVARGYIAYFIWPSNVKPFRPKRKPFVTPSARFQAAAQSGMTSNPLQNNLVAPARQDNQWGTSFGQAGSMYMNPRVPFQGYDVNAFGRRSGTMPTDVPKSEGHDMLQAGYQASWDSRPASTTRYGPSMIACRANEISRAHPYTGS